jgi:hypothetical protein
MEQENNEAKTHVKALPESNVKKQENNKKDVETPAEASTKPDSNKKEANTPLDASNRPEPSRKKTPKSLKAKTKIAKKSVASNSLNTRKDNGCPQVQRRRRRRRRRNNILKGNKETSNIEE